MKKGLLALILVCFGLGPISARADGNLNITADMIRFRYVTMDGSGDLPCTHVLESADAQDWAVNCRAGAVSKNYIVHLWVTAYSRPSVPQLSIETLYWITDLNVPNSTGRGSTSWYNFKAPSDLTEIDISQWLEDGDSQLVLNLNAS